MKSIFNIVIGVFLLGFIIVGISIYKWGMPGMNYEIPGKYLTETYKKIGGYSIGKQKFQYNVCHNNNGCIDGKILGYREVNESLYIYMDINYGLLTLGDKSGIEKKYFVYNLFKNSNREKVENLNQLPKFGLLFNNTLEFYSKNDLEKLSNDQRIVFEELEKNPSIVIDGVNYSK